MIEQAGVVRALERRGSVREIADVTGHIDALECFTDDIRWEPQLLYEVGDELWGIDIIVSTELRKRQLEAMRAAEERCDRFRSAVVVLDTEDAGDVIPQCRPYGIRVVYPVGEAYEIYEPGVCAPAAPAPAEAPCRMPPALVEKAGDLREIDAVFASVLRDFAAGHRSARERGRMSDAREAEILKETFERLIGTNAAFVGTYKPLDVLQKLEQLGATRSRDHYFHTFQNFLLGIVVIDAAYDHFRECVLEIMPTSGGDVSLEYIWLLAALFHDVGYAVQHRDDVASLMYGPTVWGPEGQSLEPSEEAVAERKKTWDSDAYQTVRRHLVSLYDHVNQEHVTEDWAFEAFPTTAFMTHPLDHAGAENFIFEGHGIAGGLRLGVEIGQSILGLADSGVRRFLTRHVFLAALSIPFHDRRFRKFLRKQGIAKMKTRRFPFAALLAFIDSIQDDRRDEPLPDSSLDVLQDLYVEGQVVKARINIAKLPEDKLLKKQVEARDLRDFLDTGGGLNYEYPREYLGETGE